MPLFFIDYWYIVLVLPVMIASLIIQGIMRSTYKKYSNVYVGTGITGAEMARRVLNENGVYDVSVSAIDGELSDHYDPRSRVIKLSREVYNGKSVSALGVACHEAGHAIQHAESYFPLVARNSFVPVVNVCSGISWFVLLIGLFMGSELMINLGIILFSTAAIFQFITLPVEFNASRRAIRALRDSNHLSDEEIQGTKKVLTAAAMTYVAALAASLASLLRLILITRGNRRR
ncbi:MAG: zinc metallopeptidase [Ruminococcaceae bacterium]|nr:zinc metallopeptidase [Oscillospiraceae bacterium]